MICKWQTVFAECCPVNIVGPVWCGAPGICLAVHPCYLTSGLSVYSSSRYTNAAPPSYLLVRTGQMLVPLLLSFYLIWQLGGWWSFDTRPPRCYSLNDVTISSPLRQAFLLVECTGSINCKVHPANVSILLILQSSQTWPYKCSTTHSIKLAHHTTQ